jgi:hypothetical protein
VIAAEPEVNEQCRPPYRLSSPETPTKPKQHRR